VRDRFPTLTFLTFQGKEIKISGCGNDEKNMGIRRFLIRILGIKIAIRTFFIGK
jgi:hypothetical protein